MIKFKAGTMREGRFEVGSFVELYFDGPSLANFKNLINKALNTFPDAHPELKELGDLLDHGKILQDYYSTRTDRRTN